MNKYRKFLWYLAGPYSHPLKQYMDERERLHAVYAVKLKEEGYAVYAPIPETTSLARLGGMTETSWEDWRSHDLNMLDRCDGIMIMTIEGWERSLGVRGEVKFALQKGMPVQLVGEDAGYLVEVTKERLLELLNVKSEEELND